MKRIVTFMGILSTTTAFANFSIEGKLEQGQELAKEVQSVSAENKILIDQAQAELAEMELRIKESVPKNPKLLKYFSECSVTLKKHNDSGVTKWYENDVQDLASKGIKKLNELKTDVAKYIEAEACKSCDVEVRKKALEKYASLITIELDFLNYLSGRRFEKDEKIRYHASKQICAFEGLFSYNDSSTFTKLKSWGIGGYNTLLSPLEVLDPRMAETLEFVADRAPVKVNRTASKSGIASSEYINGQINMKLTYDKDFITGIDNVRHPEVANPILIINRDR